MGCEPWLSPGRDCARSAARHGVLLGVRVRQLRATGAPQSEKNRTLRGSAAYLPTSLVCPKIAHPALSLRGGTVSRWRKIAHPALALRGGEEWEIENGENTVRFDRFRGGGGRGGLWRWWRGCGGVQG